MYRNLMAADCWMLLKSDFWQTIRKERKSLKTKIDVKEDDYEEVSNPFVGSWFSVDS